MPAGCTSSPRGRPTENSYVESLIGKFRYGRLRQHWFENLLDAPAKIELLRENDNQVTSHQPPNNSADGATTHDFSAPCPGILPAMAK
jgi:hypothetical protein